MVKALQDVQAQGRAAMRLDEDLDQRHQLADQAVARFRLGSFLLAQGGSEYFFFSGHKTDNALSWYGDDSVAIGSPTSDVTTSNGVYLRHFANGVVAVNPTTSAQGVSLGSTYTLPSGSRSAQATVPAHSSLILTGYRGEGRMGRV